MQQNSLKARLLNRLAHWPQKWNSQLWLQKSINAEQKLPKKYEIAQKFDA